MYSKISCLLYMVLYFIIYKLAAGIYKFVSLILHFIKSNILYVLLIVVVPFAYYYYVEELPETALKISGFLLLTEIIITTLLFLLSKLNNKCFFFAYPKFLTWKARLHGGNVIYSFSYMKNDNMPDTQAHSAQEQDNQTYQSHSEKTTNNYVTDSPPETGKKATLENDFFAGCTSAAELKKRYRDLLKIYHPDNPSGSKEMIEMIINQYENLIENFNDYTEDMK